MCIIVVKPASSEISLSNLFNMWSNNPHGAGLMYAENGRLSVIKGLMTFADFLAAYEKISNRKLVIHFRWRTHGPVLQKLTHPFVINNSVAMAHNGVIPGMRARRKESDTSMYTRILQQRYKNPMEALEDLRTRVDVLTEIGLSKLVFMNGNGKVKILNAQMGHVGKDGCWYSNHSYTDATRYDQEYGELDYDPKNWKMSASLVTL